MKTIEKLSRMIEEELEDSEKYIKCAIKYKTELPGLSKSFYDLSLAEMGHVNVLHTEVTRLIEEHRRKVGEPPAAMLAVYNYLHEKQIEEAHEIKMWQEEYRNA